MPCDYSRYPKDWKERRARILERAKHCCEFCSVPNRAVGYRDKDGQFVKLAENRACAGMAVETASLEGIRITEIVLTIAHLDRTGAPGKQDGPLDCPDDRLAALCQKCHLTLDKDRHKANRARTRQREKDRTAVVEPLF